jgi:hypothetical protein
MDAPVLVIGALLIYFDRPVRLFLAVLLRFA